MEPYPLFEDDKFVVFYKPPFWMMNTDYDYESETPERIAMFFEGDRKPFLIFIKNFMKEHYQEEVSIKNSYNVCQRLDINTSGCVLVSKRKEDWYNCRRIIDTKSITKKIYICLVSGILKEKKGFIKRFLKLEKHDNGMSMIQSSKFRVPDSKDSLSYYQVLSEYTYEKNNYSLVIIRIFTGRTHQIRVHMKSIGHPIISDDRYNLCESEAEEEECRQVNNSLINRMFLHNIFLSYKPHDKYLNVIAPAPDDIKECLKKMTMTKRYFFDIKDFIVNNIEYFNKISKYPMLDTKLYTSDDSLFEEPKYNSTIEDLLIIRKNKDQEFERKRISSRKLSLRVRKEVVLEMLKKVSTKKKSLSASRKKKKLQFDKKKKSLKVNKQKISKLEKLYKW